MGQINPWVDSRFDYLGTIIDQRSKHHGSPIFKCLENCRVRIYDGDKTIQKGELVFIIDKQKVFHCDLETFIKTGVQIAPPPSKRPPIPKHFVTKRWRTKMNTPMLVIRFKPFLLSFNEGSSKFSLFLDMEFKHWRVWFRGKPRTNVPQPKIVMPKPEAKKTMAYLRSELIDKGYTKELLRSMERSGKITRVFIRDEKRKFVTGYVINEETPPPAAANTGQ